MASQADLESFTQGISFKAGLFGSYRAQNCVYEEMLPAECKNV